MYVWDFLKMGKNSSKVRLHSGDKFNKLTAIKYEFTKTYGKCNYHYHWLFKCDCGKEKIIASNSVLKGLTTSCGCVHSEISSNVYKEINKDKFPTVGAINRLYASYKHGAESRNYCFELTKGEFIKLLSNNCYYCNRIPEQIAYNKKKTDYLIYNGIDRVNNELGYTLDNIVTCCKHCNRAKMSLSKEQFLQLIKDIYNNLNLND